jgi:hypothetical protein
VQAEARTYVQVVSFGCRFLLAPIKEMAYTSHQNSKLFLITVCGGTMKNKNRRSQFLFMAAVLTLVGAITLITGCVKIGKTSEEQLITVLNPALSLPLVERAPLAPRADTLEGKTIYLVDLQWGGPQAGYSVFEEMQKLFAKNMPSIKIELRRSSGGWMGDDPGLRKEIAEKKAAGVVIGIGG